MATQLITPNPDIWCRAGWCLEYVNNAFGVPERFDSATDAWYGSQSVHEDFNFPDGVWFPVYFALSSTPLGHIALVAPDKTVYSTSDYSNTPHHHSSVRDLMDYYAYYGMTLYYRGWSEDVELTPVISLDSIGYDSGPVIEKDDFDMATLDDLKTALKDPEVLDAIAVHLLHRECDLVDPTGLTDAVDPVRKTTLGKKVNWQANLEAKAERRLIRIEETLGTLVTLLTPAPSATADTPAPAAPDTLGGV